MSAFITEALNDRLKDEDILAVYACRFKDRQTISATSILYALAAQIAQSSLASMEKCKRFLKKYVSEGQLKAKILDVQDLIVEMSLSDDIQRIFIVIDGLDEVKWEQPDHLMAVVDIPRYARKVKMFITSRPVPLIVKALYEYSTLSLDNVALDLSLAEFINMAIKHSKFANLPQHELDEIKECLIRYSNGMFFHARMVINSLSGSYQSSRTFQQAKAAPLQEKATTLEEFYFKMLTMANNSATNALAVNNYLRILASNPEVESLTELYQAVIQLHSDVLYDTPEELAERAQGLLV